MGEKRNSKLMNYLIEQCRNPTGFIGNRMIEIWNKIFSQMALWGLSHTDIKDSDVILEIGFGGGVIINYLAKKINKGKIYGVDISNASLQKSIKLNKTYIKKGTVELLNCPVEEMSFPEKKFDKIFAIQTHIYWKEFEKSIEKIYKLLNHNGTFNIICEKDKIFYHLPNYSDKNMMLYTINKLGFKNTQIFETNKWIHYKCMKTYK